MKTSSLRLKADLAVLTRIMLLFFTLAFLLFSCKSKTGEVQKSNIEYSEELAKEIGFVTNGDVHPTDQIEVIFNSDIIPENEINSSPQDVFDFSPSLDGKAVWISQNTLVFQPEGELPLREQIDGVLDLQKLSDDFKTKQLENLRFYLNVLGRDLLENTGELVLKDRNNPKTLQYKGTLTFSEPTELALLEEETSFEDIKLNWSKIDDKTFRFISDDITRTDSEKSFTFEIDKDELELAEDYVEIITLYPLKKMAVGSVKAEEEGKSPRVRITFSDELDMEQKIGGLISVSPEISFNAKKIGKQLILDGSFKYGTTYEIEISEGIRSRWGSEIDQSKSKEITFSDIAPQIEFGSAGIILPSSNQKKVQFYTTNLKRVHLEVKKVFTDQVGRFLQSERLTSTKTRNQGFGDGYSSAVGVILKNQTLELKEKRNEWVLNEFDLSELFEAYDNGLFLIRINFNPSDVATSIEGNTLEYLTEKGQIYKPVFLSDIGLTTKIADDQTMVFATNIVDGSPMQGVNVSLLDYSGNAKSTQSTGKNGVAYFNGNPYFYNILATKNQQVTALKKQDMRWSNSGFDISGTYESYNNTKGYIYTERGVYRPGDSVHIGLIVRNANKTFPRDHPASITVRDPEYNIIYENTQVRAEDGFYTFAFNTEDAAPTGNYSIMCNAGGSRFYHDLKIETVVAEKLKVSVIPSQRVLKYNQTTLKYEVESKYLFGAPASNLKTTVDIEVYPFEKQFPKYQEFSFTRADLDYQSFSKEILSSRLDADGKLEASWELPPLGEVPSSLRAKIIVTVLEQGGQPNEGWNYLEIQPYPSFVGLKDPSGYGYYKIGEAVKFPVIALASDGKPEAGKQLQYKVYRNEKNWWYQYDNRRNFQLKYKEDNQTYLETEGTIVSSNGTTFINFTPEENGEYLIEVSDSEGGHTASLFFSAYRYGSIPGGDLNEGNLALKANKANYQVGETATIKFPNPKQGNILMTIEKGRQLLSYKWIKPSASEDEMKIDIPVTSEMIPNAYVTLSVLQPHDQTQNDRPIRMFGILPIMAKDPKTEINFAIDMAETLTPNKPFTIDVNTANQQSAQFSIAVVDEGLLSLTQFKTPDPWTSFFQKIGLQVETFDVFGHVMSANKGDVFQTFSIGGAEMMAEMDYRESQTDPVNGKKRFKAVSMFKGPISTDSRGHAQVTFEMPNYNGAVRVMVVGANGNSYGSADKTVPVKSDLIMQPTIPRVLHPGDEFFIPVSLFKINPSIKSADFTLAVDGPLEIVDNAKQSVNFSGKEDATIRYKVRVKEAVGQAHISLKGKAGSIAVNSETDITVTPTSPRVFDKNTQQLSKGSSVSFAVPKVGIDGTNYAKLDLNIFPNMDFDHRLKWLIRYPYGCIEQTTSAVFPQLFLKQMGYFGNDMAEIDENIQNGINRLQQFILSGGAFAYWPGNQSVSAWGTNYATHFLIEAKDAGYAVPQFMLNNSLNYMANQAKRHNGKLFTRVNRALILSRADKASMGELNLLMENELTKMNNTEKWMLAAAYYLAGVTNVQSNILNSASTEAPEYEPFSYHFGSKNRDMAIMLYCATLMKDMNNAELLAKAVAEKLSTTEYLSTQTSAYMLLSLAKYFEAAGIMTNGDEQIEGTITLANGKEIPFSGDATFSTAIANNFGQQIQVNLTGGNIDKLYATLSWNGVPLKDNTNAESKNLDLSVSWFDKNGNNIDPANLKQGDVFYGKFSVDNTSVVENVSDIALVQLLPSGWQIENVRLNNEKLPDWTNRWNLNKESYFDMRDDRAMWFFDLEKGEPLDFVLKLNCVSAGSFWLPGTRTETMYSNDYKANTAGKKVFVQAFTN
jgi:uncharacterized protein YfaS (alpha-2-macroglobulin family)